MGGQDRLLQLGSGQLGLGDATLAQRADDDPRPGGAAGPFHQVEQPDAAPVGRGAPALAGGDRQPYLLGGQRFEVGEAERVRSRPRRPRSRQSGSVAAATTPASSAVRPTGTPCGPLLGWRTASRPRGSSGVRVCPTLVITTSPMPAPVASSTPRREIPGVTGGGSGPALLCETGFSCQGISVSTSPVGQPGREAVADVGQLDRHVQQDGADHHVRERVVHDHEVPAERAPVQQVEEPGDQLHQGRRDQHGHAQPLEQPLRRRERRPAERVRVDRPQLDQHQRDGRDPRGDVDALGEAIAPGRHHRLGQPRPGQVLGVAEQTGQEADREGDAQRATQPCGQRGGPHGAGEVRPPGGPRRGSPGHDPSLDPDARTVAGPSGQTSPATPTSVEHT